MNQPLFGKQKPTDQPEQEQKSGGETLDFWGSEIHQPDQSQPTLSGAEPAASRSHESLPASDELLKPFESYGETETSQVEAEETTAENSEPSVRKIAGATFRRLEEPVNLYADQTNESVEETAPAAPESFDVSSSFEPHAVTPQEHESAQYTAETFSDPGFGEPQPMAEFPAPVEPTEEVVQDFAIEPDLAAEAVDSLETGNENTMSEDVAAMAAATTAPAEESEDLRTLIKEHELWLDSQGAEGRRAVFREDNLAGVDFSHQRLAGASFRGLNLARCKFIQAQLNEADFSDCNLQHCDFTAAMLDNAAFQQVDASNASFTAAQMAEVDFNAANLEHSNFVQAKIPQTNFRDANLNGANLQQVTANLAQFRGAQMENTNLSSSDFTQAVFREANLRNANFSDSNMVQAHFKDAVLSHVDLNSADFSQALDISADIQAQFMQVERAKLHNEMQKLEQIRGELEQRERALISEREQLQKQLILERNKQPAPQQAPDVGELGDRIKKTSRQFMFMGIGWFILAFFLMIILQNVFAQLDSSDLSMGEMALMGLLLVGPLVLFVVSMSKSFSISYALRKLTKHDPNEPE